MKATETAPQQQRLKAKPKITCNARIGARELKTYCALEEATLESPETAGQLSLFKMICKQLL